MISKVYTSSNPSFLFCIEALVADVRSKFGDYDFLLFSIHPSYPIESINHTIKNVFKTEDYAAFHAINAFKDDEVVEEAVTVCCFKFQNQGKINTYYIEDITSFKTDNTATQVAQYFNQNRDKFHIILTSFCDGNMGYFVDELSNKLNYTPINNIVGGVSSGILDNHELKTFQFIDNKIIKNGLMVLSFENIEGEIGTSLGFQPYGITYEISKAEGTKLYAVDDGNSFSYLINKMLNRLEVKDVRYLWYTPLQILNDKNEYTSTLRIVKAINDDYVEFFSPIEEGQHFKLSFASYENLIKEDEAIAKKMITKMTVPEISFNFSCIARQFVLEDKQQQEIGTYTKNFNTHLFGFFTFGEIGPDKMFTNLKMYNEASFAILMREV